MRQASPSDGVSHQILVDPAWCKSCGICVVTCPREALATAQNGVPFLQNPDRCTGCLLCEINCPDFALRVEGGRQ